MITRRQSLRALVGLALAGKGIPAAFAYTVPRRKKDVLDEINAITLNYIRENHDLMIDYILGPAQSWMNPNWPESPFCKFLLSGGISIQEPIGWHGND